MGISNINSKIGFGGGCHWCTEAVFQALKGVARVEQGWIASSGVDNDLSEAVIVYFNQQEIPLKVLIEIHLLTHKSTSQHSMREKYRSAVYTFSAEQKQISSAILKELQTNFEDPIITKVIPFKYFKPSEEAFVNYYKKNPNKPFCQRYIDPKLKLLKERFSEEYKNQ